MTAVLNSVYENGTPPQELIDINLCEKFGWTFDELDRADPQRLYRGIYLQRVYSVAQKAQSGQTLVGSERDLMRRILEADLENTQ